MSTASMFAMRNVKNGDKQVQHSTRGGAKEKEKDLNLGLLYFNIFSH